MSEDYWPVTFDLNEQSYEILNANGLNIPFPQMTVHLAKDQGTAKKRMKEDLTQTKRDKKSESGSGLGRKPNARLVERKPEARHENTIQTDRHETQFRMTALERKPDDRHGMGIRTPT